MDKLDPIQDLVFNLFGDNQTSRRFGLAARIAVFNYKKMVHLHKSIRPLSRVVKDLEKLQKNADEILRQGAYLSAKLEDATPSLWHFLLLGLPISENETQFDDSLRELQQTLPLEVASALLVFEKMSSAGKHYLERVQDKKEFADARYQKKWMKEELVAQLCADYEYILEQPAAAKNGPFLQILEAISQLEGVVIPTEKPYDLLDRCRARKEEHLRARGSQPL